MRSNSPLKVDEHALRAACADVLDAPSRRRVATPAMSRSSVLTCTLKMRYRLTWLISTAPYVRRNLARLDSLHRRGLLGAGGLDVEQVFQLHVRVFRILHGDEVLVAGLVVDPEIAVDRDAGVDGGHRPAR